MEQDERIFAEWAAAHGLTVWPSVPYLSFAYHCPKFFKSWKDTSTDPCLKVCSQLHMHLDSLAVLVLRALAICTRPCAVMRTAEVRCMDWKQSQRSLSGPCDAALIAETAFERISVQSVSQSRMKFHFVQILYGPVSTNPDEIWKWMEQDCRSGDNIPVASMCMPNCSVSTNVETPGAQMKTCTRSL